MLFIEKERYLACSSPVTPNLALGALNAPLEDKKLFRDAHRQAHIHCREKKKKRFEVKREGKGTEESFS